MIERTASEVLRDALSGAPLVTFAQKGVQPPAVYYLGADDVVAVSALSSITTTLQLKGRVLRPDGVISPFEKDVALTGTRASTTSSIFLGEGFLLSLVAQLSGGAPKRGQVYVICAVIRPPVVVNSFVTELLFADYADSFYTPGWPPARIIASVESAGAVRSVSGAAPAAGTDWSVTVPTGARWRLRSARAALTTSGVAGTRSVTVVLDDGANTFEQIGANATQLAGTTVSYIAGAFGVITNAAGGDTQVALVPDLVFSAGSRIRASTSGLLGGDTWTAQTLLVEEWLEL